MKVLPLVTGCTGVQTEMMDTWISTWETIERIAMVPDGPLSAARMPVLEATVIQEGVRLNL